MLDLRGEIDARCSRWRSLFSPESGPPYVFLIRYQPDAFERPWPMPDQVPQRIDWAWHKYCRMVEQCTWIEDDTLPYLEPYTGTEIFAEAFGAEVYRPDNDMPFARPVIGNAGDAAKIKAPSLDCPSFHRMFEIADELRRRAGPDALMRLVDIQSPMDIAAILWDKNDFYVSLVEAPDAVLEFAEKIAGVQTSFLDEWFSRYGTRTIAHYPDYYMEGGITLSEDEVGAVSADLFEEMFLPELNRLSDRYGGIGIHCCAHARHQWDSFRKIRGLRLLNFVQPEAVVKEAYAFFGTDVVHWHSWNGNGDPWTWKDQLPPAQGS